MEETARHQSTLRRSARPPHSRRRGVPSRRKPASRSVVFSPACSDRRMTLTQTPVAGTVISTPKRLPFARHRARGDRSALKRCRAAPHLAVRRRLWHQPRRQPATRDFIGRGRLNATSVMTVGSAIGRDEIRALQAATADSPRCAVGLHVTLTAPFRPLTMHFKPADGGMFPAFPKLLRAGLSRAGSIPKCTPNRRCSSRPLPRCSAAPRTSSTAISIRSYSRRCATRSWRR